MKANLIVRTLPIFLLSFVGLSLAYHTPSSAAPMCREVLKPLPPPSMESALKVLGDLADLKLELDTALAQGQMSSNTRLLQQTFAEKSQSLFTTLERHRIMTTEQAKEKMKEIILKKQNLVADETKKHEEKRAEEVTAMEDIKVMPGAARLNAVEAGGKITKPFFMSQSPITQRQWAIVASLAGADRMKLNPSVHHDRENAKEVELPNGEKVKIQPENPVEFVNAVRDPQNRDYYDSVHNFIDFINEMSKRDDPLLYQLIAGHKKNMVYSLPSVEQFEHVASDMGRGKDISASKLHQYAHIESRYSVGTMPVGSLKPFEVANGKYFDLLGNVGTWTSTIQKDGTIVVKGGSYTSSNKLKFKNSAPEEATVQSETIGFRIVGELP